ncbi:MAG: protein kinase [Planctomycetes bacterium]|nr:protein kinase [Planctomycetota bacterium]
MDPNRPNGEAPDAEAGISLDDAARAELERYRISHETRVLTILFSDMVGSTRLQSQVGNLRAAEIVKRHRRIFRRVLERFDCREIGTAGDSMLIVFAAPSDAVKGALHLQRTVRRAREEESDLPAVRIGIHQGQVVFEEAGAESLDIYGLQVSTAARIMDLGGAAQILCSRSVFDDARAILRRQDFEGFATIAWCNHGPYRFKGVEDSHEVCEVGEEGFAPLAPPRAGAKGWPADHATEELGWRPAAGVRVPESSWILSDKLGEGEFGEVWKAYNDADKSHQVYKFCFKRDRLPALKREARLLKRLRKYSHPNIVEVYDVTVGERPPHYLEMEYVAGPTLREWLEGDPPLGERLEVIAQIADALDTVHAAGIYHRDIKPANILLTYREDGALRAKLTDFGLGAAEDEDLLKSIFASRVSGVAGTWDYIAPEIRQGRNASPQSDLYSLGLTLYQIAVGDVERPLTADWEEQVPSEVLREDIRRCVAQSPADRWPRAAELAKALRAHDERERARALEAERERQRARMHRLRRLAAVIAGFAAVTLALGGAALIEWKEAAHQRDRAIEQEREAARQRDRALAQKALALEAIDQLTHEVPLRLRDIPGTLPALRKILEENIGILDRILALDPDTPAAVREKGVNSVSVGDRWMLLGDTTRALAAYEVGIRIAEGLAASEPERIEYRHDLSVAYDRLGRIRAALGRTTEALEAYEKAMALTRDMAANAPETPGVQRDLWFGYDRLGTIYLKLGRTEDARKAYEEGLAITKRLSEAAPEDSQAQRDVSLAWERIGDVRVALGELPAALAAYEICMDIGRRRAAAFPDSAEARRDLSVGCDKLGGIYLKLERTDDARKAYEEALAISKALAAEEPENVLLQRDLSVAHDRLGDVYATLGRAKDALAAYRAAMEIAEVLAASDPGNASAQYDLSAGFSKLGNAYLAASRTEDALGAYAKALGIVKKLADAEPNDAMFQRSIAVLSNKVGTAQIVLGRIGDAIRSFEGGLAVASRRAGADPKNLEAARDVGISLFKLMAAQRFAGNLETWRAHADRGIAAFQRILDASPENPQARTDLIAALAEATDGLAAFPSPTLDDIRTGLSRARRLVELTEGSEPQHLATLAFFLHVTGDAAGAAEAMERAIERLPAGEAGADLRRQYTERLEAYRKAAAAAAPAEAPPEVPPAPTAPPG